jgi:hypothetical protein
MVSIRPACHGPAWTSKSNRLAEAEAQQKENRPAVNRAAASPWVVFFAALLINGSPGSTVG